VRSLSGFGIVVPVITQIELLGELGPAANLERLQQILQPFGEGGFFFVGWHGPDCAIQRPTS
jgi:hypothetical protein